MDLVLNTCLNIHFLLTNLKMTNHVSHRVSWLMMEVSVVSGLEEKGFRKLDSWRCWQIDQIEQQQHVFCVTVMMMRWCEKCEENREKWVVSADTFRHQELPTGTPSIEVGCWHLLTSQMQNALIGFNVSDFRELVFFQLTSDVYCI